MSRDDERYAALLLEWARTIHEHGDADYEAWIEQRKHQTERSTMYELIDERNYGQESDRPLMIVERYPMVKGDQLRRVFSFTSNSHQDALEVLRALNERDIEEGRINAAA
jgi:hypothetical protein